MKRRTKASTGTAIVTEGQRSLISVRTGATLVEVCLLVALVAIITATAIKASGASTSDALVRAGCQVGGGSESSMPCQEVGAPTPLAREW